VNLVLSLSLFSRVKNIHVPLLHVAEALLY